MYHLFLDQMTVQSTLDCGCCDLPSGKKAASDAVFGQVESEIKPSTTLLIGLRTKEKKKKMLCYKKINQKTCMP